MLQFYEFESVRVLDIGRDLRTKNKVQVRTTHSTTYEQQNLTGLSCLPPTASLPNGVRWEMPREYTIGLPPPPHHHTADGPLLLVLLLLVVV